MSVYWRDAPWPYPCSELKSNVPHKTYTCLFATRQNNTFYWSFDHPHSNTSLVNSSLVNSSRQAWINLPPLDGNLRIGLRWKILNWVENNQPNEKHIASLDVSLWMKFSNQTLSRWSSAAIVESKIWFDQIAVLSLLRIYSTCCWITNESNTMNSP